MLRQSLRPSPSRAPRTSAHARRDDKRSRVNRLNGLFYEQSPMLSGEELSAIMHARFGGAYRPDIVTRSWGRCLVLSRNEQEPGPSEMIHFNKVAEVINSECDPERVKNAILCAENAIIGSENIEIPI